MCVGRPCCVRVERLQLLLPVCCSTSCTRGSQLLCSLFQCVTCHNRALGCTGEHEASTSTSMRGSAHFMHACTCTTPANLPANEPASLPALPPPPALQPAPYSACLPARLPTCLPPPPPPCQPAFLRANLPPPPKPTCQPAFPPACRLTVNDLVNAIYEPMEGTSTPTLLARS